MSESAQINSNIPKSIIYELGIETAKILNEKQEELQNITWKNGEANLDTEYSKLACVCCEVAWNIIKKKYPQYDEVYITCNISDIKITFTYSDGRTSKDKIELKSSIYKIMTGSTISSLDINQPLIYCLRPSNASEPYNIKCSQYYSAIYGSDIDLFQDRTPRPRINFEKMNEIDNTLPFNFKEKDAWIEHYAKCGLKRIDGNTKCQKSWQDNMIKIMKKNIIEEYINNTTKEQFIIDKTSLQILNININ